MFRQHSGQFRTGLWFEKYPSFDKYEQGRIFRYKKMSGHQSEQSIGNGNLEYQNNTMNIVTTTQLPFVIRTYVLIDESLYIINEIQTDEVQGQAQRLLKNSVKKFTMMLTKVDNAKEVSIN